MSSTAKLEFIQKVENIQIELDSFPSHKLEKLDTTDTSEEGKAGHSTSNQIELIEPEEDKNLNKSKELSEHEKFNMLKESSEEMNDFTNMDWDT